MTAAAVEQIGTDQETVILEGLEFEVPCDILTGGEECHDTAEWVMVLRPHCPRSGAMTRLVCDHHYRYVVDGGIAYCTDCDTHGLIVRDYVLQLERIKP